MKLFHMRQPLWSQEQILVKILSLQEQIIDFSKGKNKHCELSDANFHRDVAFVCDVMSK